MATQLSQWRSSHLAILSIHFQKLENNTIDFHKKYLNTLKIFADVRSNSIPILGIKDMQHANLIKLHIFYLIVRHRYLKDNTVIVLLFFPKNMS